MSSIFQKINLNLPVATVFDAFVNEFNNWWPKEYTWSQDKLVEINIGTELNAPCFEIGPHGFRCDWGRVISFSANKKIKFTWQIGPNRDPVPDPEKASEVLVTFTNQEGKTQLTLEHSKFDNHSDGGMEYQKMMASKQGWNYILEHFKKYISS